MSMRFGKMFTRVYDSVTPANTTLGTDTGFNPYEDHTANTVAHPSLADCLYETRVTNINGFPVQRLVVGYMPPSGGTPTDLAATMYLFDEASGFWYLVQGAQQAQTAAVTQPMPLPKGALTFFDTPAFTDNPNSGNAPNASGSMRVIVIVSIPAGHTPNNGVHTFVIGSDVSNPGL